MTEEERKAKDAARKREAYARRKQAKAEAIAQQASPEELTTLFNEQARNIAPELEEAFRNAKGTSEISPVYQENHKDATQYVSNREKAEAVQSEAVAREEYVDMLFAKYAKNTNIPQLLQGIIREQIETRVVLVDLLAEILNNTRK